MLSETIRQRLRDPAYLDRHLAAASVAKGLRRVPWYDAHFLNRFAAAKKYLAIVAPELLDDFIAGFAPLRTPQDFTPVVIEELLDPEQLAEVRQLAQSIPQEMLECHELRSFGRHVVHDHPAFTRLQRQLQPRVEKLLGRRLVSGYNFLSLYNAAGRCEPHLDEPFSMYTLDLCIAQDVEWPIYFSKIIDWSEAEELLQLSPSQLRQRDDLEFRQHVLEPNKALIFCGSGQWHYRDPMPGGGFCHLLFLHFYPEGCDDLVRPERWAGHFGYPELEPLCDLFTEAGFGEEQDQATQ